MRGRGFRGCCVVWLIAGLLGLAFLSGLVVFIRKRRARPSADDTLVADLLGPPELPEFPAPRTWDDGPPSPAQQERENGRPARTPRQPWRARRQPSAAPQTQEDGRPAHAPGQPSPAAAQSSPAPQAREDGGPARAPRQPSPAAGQPSPAAGQPSPAAGQPSPAAGQPSPAAGQPSPASQAQEDGQPAPVPASPPAAAEDWLETQLAWINAWSQRMNEQITSGEQPERHSKE